MILVPFLPLGIPHFEVALSILRRWVTGQALFLGDGNHLHHRLLGKIKAPRPTVAIFYFFSASLNALTLLMVLEVQSPVLRFLTGFLTLGLMLAVTWSVQLYGNKQTQPMCRPAQPPPFQVSGGIPTVYEIESHQSQIRDGSLGVTEIRDQRSGF